MRLRPDTAWYTFCKLPGSLICQLVCSVLALSLLRVDAVADEKKPLIAGFERFSRHGDTSLETAGILLISELSCTACHPSANPALTAKTGPVLTGVGNRLNQDWIRRFLESPSQEKPGTTMPDLLSSLPAETRADAADAVAAYLSTLQQPFPDIKASGANPVPSEFWQKGHPERGRTLYHQIGCVACHAADESYRPTAVQPSPIDDMLEQLDPDELKELGLSSAARRFASVPLPQLALKYSAESLTFFLLNPEHTRPSGRMPNFQLQAVDAADLAAWLLKPEAGPANDDLPNHFKQPSAEIRKDSDQISRGRRLVEQLRCRNCHDLKDIADLPSAISMDRLDLNSRKSCIHSSTTSPAGSGMSKPVIGQPVFVVDELQQQAFAAAMKATEAPQALTLQLLQYNCYACHERDALGGVGRDRKPYFETAGGIDIGDEGRLPPALSGVGKRLTTKWMMAVLNGQGLIRPHMKIRMPVFPSKITNALPAMISIADGADSNDAPADDVFASGDREELRKAGRRLMDIGCVQCHAFKGESLPGVVGVDLEGVTRRLRTDWLHDFLKDPGALKVRTRMPTFFPDGQSQNPDVFDGHMELQLSAMYAYLDDLPNQPLPAKIEEARSKNYELVPVDRPVILRTFMPEAGTHAIAVGYPQKLHVAFDAEQVRLAEIWKGRFLDAEGTWFVRSAPPASPLGERRFRMPRGPIIARMA
ncbi:MAG: c-type cytochrome, partial [Planctomycetota bacterium]